MPTSGTDGKGYVSNARGRVDSGEASRKVHRPGGTVGRPLNNAVWRSLSVVGATERCLATESFPAPNTAGASRTRVEPLKPFLRVTFCPPPASIDQEADVTNEELAEVYDWSWSCPGSVDRFPLGRLGLC